MSSLKVPVPTSRATLSSRSSVILLGDVLLPAIAVSNGNDQLQASSGLIFLNAL